MKSGILCLLMCFLAFQAQADDTKRKFSDSTSDMSGSWMYVTPDGSKDTIAGYVFSDILEQASGSRRMLSIQCYEGVEDIVVTTIWDSPLYPIEVYGFPGKEAQMVIYSIDQTENKVLLQYPFLNGQTFSKGEKVWNMIRRMRLGTEISLAPVIGPDGLQSEPMNLSLIGISRALRLACGWHQNYWKALQPVSDKGEINYSSND